LWSKSLDNRPSYHPLNPQRDEYNRPYNIKKEGEKESPVYGKKQKRGTESVLQQRKQSHPASPVAGYLRRRAVRAALSFSTRVKRATTGNPRDS
jgi:hypothetical protein